MKNLEKFFGTQKLWVCVVILVLVCAGTVFAQQSRTQEPAQSAPAQSTTSSSSSSSSGAVENAISLEFMQLVKGILMSDPDNDQLFIPLSVTYEHLIAPHMTIGGNLDMYFGHVGRKPAPNDSLIPYFYFGVTAAFRYYPMSTGLDKLFVGGLLGFNVQSIDGKSQEKDGGFAGPLIGVNFGYKALIDMFFVEPSMSYVLSKASAWALGWQGGLRLGIAF